MKRRILEIFHNKNRKAPFTEWLLALEKSSQIRIRDRLTRLELGNLGDYKSLGDGLFELRFHFGPGYRIYFGEVKQIIILLLAGGDKNSQEKDIKKAKEFWKEYWSVKDEKIQNI